MGRLKKDHSGYRTHGLWVKYQTPQVVERNKPKSKKDTRKWCRGKVGVEHQLIRYFWHYGWDRKKTNWIRTKCRVCDKEFGRKNDPSVPLYIEVDEEGKVFFVQVKVNGKALPMEPHLYGDEWWCEHCRTWHY